MNRLLVVLMALAAGYGALQQAPPPPTFNGEIGPILFDRCTPCHRPNGDGPFSLTSYDEVKRHSGLVRIQTLTQRMPPTWIHSEMGAFAPTRQLTDAEIVLIQKWIQGGMPEGDGPAVKPKLHPVSWRIEKPDAIAVVAKGEKTRPDGVRYWQARVVDLPKGIEYIDSFDVRPERPYSLQNVQLALIPPGRKAPTNVFETAGSMDITGAEWIGAWAPGTDAWSLPLGFAKRIPAGSRLLVQAHYQPTGKAEPAGFTLGFSKAKPDSTPVDWITQERKSFVIQALDAPDFEFEYVLPRAKRLVSLLPEARFYASRVRVIATLPDGQSKTLFENYRWNPYQVGNWAPRVPIELAAGTRLKTIISYANDETCTMNEGKSPTAVYSGPKIENEVCRIHFLLVPTK